jgi:hypothetical protein
MILILNPHCISLKHCYPGEKGEDLGLDLNLEGGAERLESIVHSTSGDGNEGPEERRDERTAEQSTEGIRSNRMRE